MSEKARYTKTWDYRDFVNALRECLGKDPLYGQSQEAVYKTEFAVSDHSVHSGVRNPLVTFPEYEGERFGKVRHL